jgi:Fur family ferric uptake transcriptional regulator
MQMQVACMFCMCNLFASRPASRGLFLIDEVVTVSMNKSQAKQLLRTRGLRATSPRVAVLRVLERSERPISHSEVLEDLGDSDWDPATIYRNLIKLRDAGVAPVVSQAGGVDRYALQLEPGDGHRHAHFNCNDCGRLSCLPAELTASMSVDGRWLESIKRATVHLHGACPDCLGT